MRATIRFQSILSSRLLSGNVKVKIQRTVILPVVLYQGETGSLTLRKERRVRVFVNRVLRRIFGPKKDEVTEEWRKLRSGEFHNLYSPPNIIRQIKSRRMRWAGHVARMAGGETCTGFWWESPKESDHSVDQAADGGWD
jgi:hypothetical protein